MRGQTAAPRQSSSPCSSACVAISSIIDATPAKKTRERQAEQERQATEATRKFKQRLRAAAAVIALTLSAAGYFFYSSFTQWENNRAWAALDSAASGRRYPLQQDVANIGRPTKAMD